eukprot:1159972-Pelagomonas_calceolata.AAC.4
MLVLYPNYPSFAPFYSAPLSPIGSLYFLWCCRYSAALQPCSCPPPSAHPTRPSSPPPSPIAGSSYITPPAPPHRLPDWAGTFSTGLAAPPHPNPQTPTCAAPTGPPVSPSLSPSAPPSAPEPRGPSTPSSLPTYITFNPPAARSPASHSTGAGTPPASAAAPAAAAVAVNGIEGDALLLASGPKCSASAPHPITILELARGFHGKQPRASDAQERSHPPNSHASTPLERGDLGVLGLGRNVQSDSICWSDGDAPCVPFNIPGSPDMHTGSISLGQGVAGAKGVASSLAATVAEDAWVDLPHMANGMPSGAAASADPGRAAGTSPGSIATAAAAAGSPRLSPFSSTPSRTASQPSPTQLGSPSPCWTSAEFEAECSSSAKAAQPFTPKQPVPAVQGGLSRAFQNKGTPAPNGFEGGQGPGGVHGVAGQCEMIWQQRTLFLGNFLCTCMRGVSKAVLKHMK